MIDHGGSPKRIGSRAAAASAAVRWRPWLLLLGLALAGGPALPQVATAGSLPVTRDGKASWDSHEATPAQNGGSDGRAPRGGESTSGLDVADERAGRHAGGRGQPTSHELDGRGVQAAEGAAAPPTAIPDQPTVLTERRDPSERSPAGRTGRRSQEPGSAVEQGSPDRRRPSGDDDRSYGTVPPQPESVSAPLTARNNLNGPPEGSRDRSRPSRHSGSPDARRSQRDVPRQAAPVPSPDDPGAVRVGRDDVTRSGPPDAPSDGQVGTSASAVSHNAQLQLSAPGARDARQPDSGTVAASRPAVSQRGGADAVTRPGGQPSRIAPVTSEPQPTSVKTAVERLPSSVTTPHERPSPALVTARSWVIAPATQAGDVALSDFCAPTGSACAWAQRQTAAGRTASWSGGDRSHRRHRASRKSNARDGAPDRDVPRVGSAPEPRGFAGGGVESAGSGQVAMLTSWVAALAGLLLFARFAAQATWRSVFGPLPLERPG